MHLLQSIICLKLSNLTEWVWYFKNMIVVVRKKECSIVTRESKTLPIKLQVCKLCACNNFVMPQKAFFLFSKDHTLFLTISMEIPPVYF